MTIKCKCKTLKKSICCNALKLENEILRENETNKSYIECSEKCKARQNKNSQLLTNEIEKENLISLKTKEVQNIKIIGFISLFLLIIAIILFYINSY